MSPPSGRRPASEFSTPGGICPSPDHRFPAPACGKWAPCGHGGRAARSVSLPANIEDEQEEQEAVGCFGSQPDSAMCRPDLCANACGATGRTSTVGLWRASMDTSRLSELLRSVQSGSMSVEEAVEALAYLPYED